jgi:hypothetical protein
MMIVIELLAWLGPLGQTMLTWVRPCTNKFPGIPLTLPRSGDGVSAQKGTDGALLFLELTQCQVLVEAVPIVSSLKHTSCYPAHL